MFAPTDAAFAALPAGTLDDLLKPQNREKLTAILTYHVVPGRMPAARVAAMDSATTVQGDVLDIRLPATRSPWAAPASPPPTWKPATASSTS